MKEMSSDMREEIAEYNEKALVFDGHANAIIGMAVQHGKRPLVLYDPVKIVDNLVLEGMTHDEAIEFYEFNIAGAFMGSNTPMILIRLETMGVTNDADVDEGNP
jgi:hypothetical protein